MKIGILTFHMAHNCGAMLQAFALCSFFNSFQDITCEIIDYRLSEIYKKYEDLLQQSYVEPRRLKFEQYLNNVLPLSNRLSNLNDINQYDLYVVGSDQVWNKTITRGYKDEYFAKKFPPNSFCVSYAASTGKKLDEPFDFVKKLDKFKFVSVRESWLQKELSEHYPGKISLCLDPVFLIDKKEWDLHIKNINLNLSRYVLIYSFDMTEDEYIRIEEWANKNNLYIIELITHKRTKHFTITYFDNYGPREWLQYIKKASYIFTDSYHCSLFSIIYNIPFCCLSHGLENNERTYDILERLKLYQNKDEFYTSSNQTRFEINREKTESLNFMKEVLNRVKDEKTNI